MEGLTAPPVLHCIYCLRKDGTFINEHIVPFALGGRHILPQCVCKECQDSINKHIEGPLLHQMLIPARAKYKYPSRNKSRKNVRELRLLSILGNKFNFDTVETPAATYTGPTFMAFIAEPPRILTRVPFEQPPQIGIAMDLRNIVASKLIMMSAPPIDLAYLFTRMLAKIAYSYAHFLGLSFEPFVLGVMRGTNSFTPFIGKAEIVPDAASDQHYILSFREVDKLVIVSVGLFLGTPVAVNYDIVVGRKN